MTWSPLTSEQDLDALDAASSETHCLIYKHSSRCDLSAMTKYALESGWAALRMPVLPYFLDVLAYPELSRSVSRRYAEFHESPQILLIRDAGCILEASGLDISLDEINEFA